jgi:transposase InsO family protein
MSTNINSIKGIDVAHFRFALIAPVIQGIFPDATKTAYYRRVTEKPLTLPSGVPCIYNHNTLEKWESLYKRGGMDALLPTIRADKGVTRTLTDAAIEEIYRLREKYPKLNSTQVYHRLISEALIPTSVSVAAVQRFVKQNDLRSARNPNIKDRKAFEEEFFGGMWQGDTCYTPYIIEEGVRRRTYLLMLIDDHSRMIVGGRFFYNDNAYNFQQVLKDAVAAYGIPNKLYVDNGSPYKNQQLTLICGSVGSVLLHTPVRDGASKGKIERNFRTLKNRWLYGLDDSQITSLEEFNSLLADYIRTHNTTVHSGTKMTPMERFMQSNHKIKKPKSQEWLDQCFMNRVERKVGNDSTISIEGESYDAPMQFIGLKVEVRFLPKSMEDAYIFYEKKSYPIRKTNKFENSRSKRLNTPSIDYSKKEGAINV